MEAENNFKGPKWDGGINWRQVTGKTTPIVRRLSIVINPCWKTTPVVDFARNYPRIFPSQILSVNPHRKNLFRVKHFYWQVKIFKTIFRAHTLLRETSQYLHFIVISSQVQIIYLVGINDFNLFSSFNYLFWVIILYYPFCK